MDEKDLFKKALEASKQKGLVITNADPDRSGIEEGHFHLVSTEGKILARINLAKLKTNDSLPNNGRSIWFSNFKNATRLIFYGFILYSCSSVVSPFFELLPEIAVQSLIGDDTSLGICKSKVAAKAHRLFGPIGELKIKGEINELPLNMISFLFADEKGILYRASCRYPETYPEEGLVIKVEKEN